MFLHTDFILILQGKYHITVNNDEHLKSHINIWSVRNSSKIHGFIFKTCFIIFGYVYKSVGGTYK